MIATEMTLTDRAVAELSEFNGQIASLQPYGELTVAADGIGKVEEAHKAVKRLNAAIEKKRKELKSGALEYGRTVDSIAKQLSSAVDAIEGKLGAERERYEEAKAAERKDAEAEKQKAIQTRIDQCTAEGIAVSLEKVSLPEDEFLWWFATEKKAAQKRREGHSRAGQFAALGFSEPAETLAELSSEAWAAMLEEAQRKHASAQARIEKERKAAEAFAEQQRQEREALAAKLKAEQEEIRAERERIAAEREELRQAQLREQREREAREAELIEKRRAEERKRREDAAKPELEKLTVVVESIKAHSHRMLEQVGTPSWSSRFAVEIDVMASRMEDFVMESQ